MDATTATPTRDDFEAWLDFPRERMSQTQRKAAKYRKDRVELLQALGGLCVECGNDDLDALEFDHKSRADRTWRARDTSRWQRLANYKREAAEGKIQLLCRSCNGRKNQHHNEGKDGEQ